MTVLAQDLTRYQQMLHILDGMVQHRRAHPTTKSDELYYELMHKYHQRLIQAQEAGQPIAGYGVMIPNEILWAMDITPLHLEIGSSMPITVLKQYEEAFAISKSFGLAVELCSAHRAMAAVHSQGWVPRPNFVVWCSTICVSCAKSGELIKELWQVPGFFLDRPFGNSPKEIEYFAQELGEMVSFLEEQTGRPMDGDRLRQAVAVSQRQVELLREINELRKRVPCPTLNRWAMQFIPVDWLFGGTPEALAFFTVVRDQMKELAGRGKAPFPEKFRLLSVFPPPLHSWKLMDWLQRERGACLVGDPMDAHWAEWAVDLDQPLLSLARKVNADPHGFTMHGRVEGAVEACVQDARELGVEGAIYWAAVGCKQGCAMIRTVKDALREEVGIPTLVIDMDVNDPTFVPEDELKDKLEGFLETLEQRK